MNMGPCPITVECPIVAKDPCCRILGPLEALPLCIDHDPVSLARKLLMVLRPFEPNQDLSWKLPFRLDSTTFIRFGMTTNPKAIILNILHIINVKKFLSRNENSYVVLVMEIRSNSIRKPFSLSFMSVAEGRFDYLFVWEVSKIVF